MNTSDLDAVKRFCHAQLALIDSEQSLDAESSAAALQHYGKKELERRGQALTQCQVAGTRTGFGGKTLVEIERAAGGKGAGVQQNAHCPMGQAMRTGDLIRIEQQLSGSATKKQLGDAAVHGVEGVVTKAQDDRIVVALTREEAETPAQGLQVWCIKLANTVTYERMRRHVKTLLKQVEEGSSRPSALHRILLQNEAPSVLDAELLVKKVHFYDAGLNGPQQQAVRHALAARELSIIHGPPGTGKTSTLVEIIRQCTAKGLRLLVCSASNIAVDNFAERLAAASVPLVRVGHPARLLPSITQHALDVLVSQSDSAQLVRDIRKELDGNLQTMSKVKLGRGAPTNGPAAGGKDRKRGLYLENKQLRQELRQRERVCTTQVLAESRVVLATLHGSGGGVLRGQVFDVAVIDEAAQALEAQCWIALSQVSKVILAGDHLQLPPVVKTENMVSVLKAYGQRVAQEDGVMTSSMSLLKEAPDSTLFLRLLKRFETQRRDDVVSFLSIQYRMHAAICKFPSDMLYAGRLQPPDAASSKVGAHLLKDLPGVADTDDTRVPLVFIDTQGFELYEDAQEESGFSRSNEAECELIQAHVNALLGAGVKAEEMAVLTPYSAQVALLSARFFDPEQTGGRDYTGLEVGTVDGMQGREKEAVLLTLVRSQPPGHRSSDESKATSVGFLNDERRLNVAMTRARRHLCVLGDAETVGARLGNDDDALRVRWMAYLTEHADLRFPET